MSINDCCDLFYKFVDVYCQVFLNAKHNDDVQMECSPQLDLSCPDSLFEMITSKVSICLLSVFSATGNQQSVVCYVHHLYGISTKILQAASDF